MKKVFFEFLKMILAFTIGCLISYWIIFVVQPAAWAFWTICGVLFVLNFALVWLQVKCKEKCVKEGLIEED